MKRIGGSALLALVLGLTLWAGSASAWNSNYFHSPTGNIRCRYFPNSQSRILACTTLNTGRIVGVTPYGSSFTTFDTTGYAFPAGPTLGYGRYWTYKGYRCDSSFSGMRCRSGNTGHGFFINRTRYQLF
jgi:hypothetical protein